MKTFYTAYTKTINGTNFYFIKKFKAFPEYTNVPPILESYGMHTNFKKACKIAMINDSETQQELINKLQNISTAKVVPLNSAEATETNVYKLRRRQITFPSLLRLIGLG